MSGATETKYVNECLPGRRGRRASGLLVSMAMGLAVVAGACGDDDASPSGAGTTTTSPPAAATTVPAATTVQAAPSSTAPAADAPRSGGTLTYGVFFEPRGMDPAPARQRRARRRRSICLRRFPNSLIYEDRQSGEVKMQVAEF